MKNILLVWEAGNGKSHLKSLLTIAENLNALGQYRLYFASFDDAVSKILPDYIIPLTIQKDRGVYRKAVIDTLDARYIVQGLSDIGQVTRYCAWYNLITAQYNIKLIISDFSPYAQLFAYGKNFPIVAVQSAYFTPPSAPYLRRLTSGALTPDAKDNRLLTETINRYLEPKGKSVADVSDIYKHGKLVTTSFKDFDVFSVINDIERELTYLGPIVPLPTNSSVIWGNPNKLKVVVYADHNKLAVPAIIEELILHHNADVVLISADGYIISKIRQELRSSITTLTSPDADLRDYIFSADLVVSNANEYTTYDTVRLGVPSLMLPVHPNQVVIAKVVELNGLGITVNPSAISGVVSTFIANLSGYKQRCLAYGGAQLVQPTPTFTAVMSAISEQLEIPLEIASGQY